MHPGIAPNPGAFQQRYQPYNQDSRYDHGYDQYQEPYEQDHNRPVGPMAAGAAVGAAAGWGASHADRAPSNQHSYMNTPTGSDEWDNHDRGPSPFIPQRQNLVSHSSTNSQDHLTSHAYAPALNVPPAAYAHYSDRTDSPNRLGPYRDAPGQTGQFSRERLDNMVFIDPHNLAEDGDDGLGPRGGKRSSRVTVMGSNNNSRAALPTLAAAGAAASSASVLGKHPAGGMYSSVPADPIHEIPNFAEKSQWAADEARKRKKRRIILFTLGILLVLGIIAAIVVAIIVSNNNNKNANKSSQSAAADDASGDLSKDSAEIKALLNNKNLHQVFSGMAYTPLNAQYPDCLTNPPSQNNITRDMAVISQLTNTVRLYGTDCNQTEMVLHAIDRLAIPNMKIWPGVWLGNNGTTNTRQINQMWKILDTYGTKQMKGVILGNEVLFRKDLTSAQLGANLTTFKKNMTSKGYNIPLATSDLGDNWTADLASEVDVVMSNIHPFFGGIDSKSAASWSYNFWQTHDVILTAGTTKQNVISEIGWPSQGGTDCGGAASCTAGATAGITEMNTFMGDWVCQAMANGTDYFW